MRLGMGPAGKWSGHGAALLSYLLLVAAAWRFTNPVPQALIPVSIVDRQVARRTSCSGRCGRG